jgi:hypothetical protein
MRACPRPHAVRKDHHKEHKYILCLKTQPRQRAPLNERNFKVFYTM